MSAFEASKQGGQTPSISINISGLSSPTVDTVEDVIDVTDVEVKDYDQS